MSQAGGSSGGGSTPGDEGFKWNVVTAASVQAKIHNGYIVNNSGTCVITLPAVSKPGDGIAVVGMNNSTGWKIAQNAGNQIRFNSLSTTAGVGGYLQSTVTSNAVNLLCITANAIWTVLDNEGNLTVV